MWIVKWPCQLPHALRWQSLPCGYNKLVDSDIRHYPNMQFKSHPVSLPSILRYPTDSAASRLFIRIQIFVSLSRSIISHNCPVSVFSQCCTWRLPRPFEFRKWVEFLTVGMVLIFLAAKVLKCTHFWIFSHCFPRSWMANFSFTYVSFMFAAIDFRVARTSASSLLHVNAVDTMRHCLLS